MGNLLACCSNSNDDGFPMDPYENKKRELEKVKEIKNYKRKGDI